jgi:ADP-ribose pyrophosphatase YjhB (NUDIX family)
MTAREFPSAPRIGVGAVVLDEEGRVLLVKRANDPGKGRWSLPGGLLELGEMIETAVAREVAEETGIAVAVMARIDLVERIYFEDGSAGPDSSANL